MNRSFSVEMTPARARLFVAMRKHSVFKLDDQITELAEKDKIADHQFQEVGVDDPIERAGIQFVHDMNFRAGIPVTAKDRGKADRIMRAAITLAGMDKNDEVANIAPSQYGGYKFEDLHSQRRKLFLLDLDTIDPLNAALIGKMFPRLILVGAMSVQYSFSFGTQSATSSRMGAILFPAVEDAIKKSTWKKTQPRSLIAMGVFPDFLDDKMAVPQKISAPFIVPKTFEY